MRLGIALARDGAVADSIATDTLSCSPTSWLVPRFLSLLRQPLLLVYHTAADCAKVAVTTGILAECAAERNYPLDRGKYRCNRGVIIT